MAPYIVAQMLGAMAGQVAIVVTHKPYYDLTTNPDDILATFSTVNAARSRLNGFLSELLGSVVLFSCALAIINSPLTDERARRRAPGARVPGVGARRRPRRSDRSGAQPGA